MSELVFKDYTALSSHPEQYLYMLMLLLYTGNSNFCLALNWQPLQSIICPHSSIKHDHSLPIVLLILPALI